MTTDIEGEGNAHLFEWLQQIHKERRDKGIEALDDEKYAALITARQVQLVTLHIEEKKDRFAAKKRWRL